MRSSFLVLTIFTAFSRGAYGIKLNVNLHTLGKRQTADGCISTCDTYETYMTQCSSQAGSTGYAGCICSNQAVQELATCINCGIQYSTSQSEVNTIESSVNSYISACAELGYPVTVSLTTQPTVTFPCTIDISTGVPTAATVTVTTGAPTLTTTSAPILLTTTSANPLDGLSIDPGELSLLSSLLGATVGT